MEPNMEERLQLLEQKVDDIWVSVEKTRKYLLITAWVTIAVIVLPLIGLMFAIPAMIDTLTTGLVI